MSWLISGARGKGTASLADDVPLGVPALGAVGTEAVGTRAAVAPGTITELVVVAQSRTARQAIATDRVLVRLQAFTLYRSLAAHRAFTTHQAIAADRAFTAHRAFTTHHAMAALEAHAGRRVVAPGSAAARAIGWPRARAGPQIIAGQPAAVAGRRETGEVPSVVVAVPVAETRVITGGRLAERTHLARVAPIRGRVLTDITARPPPIGLGRSVTRGLAAVRGFGAAHTPGLTRVRCPAGLALRGPGQPRIVLPGTTGVAFIFLPLAGPVLARWPGVTIRCGEGLGPDRAEFLEPILRRQVLTIVG